MDPDEIERKTFRFGRNGGYDPDEVHAFLSAVAQSFRVPPLEPDVPEADPLRVGDDVVAILEAARASADQTRRRAEDHASRTRSDAELYAKTLVDRAETYLAERKTEAEEVIARAESAVKQAEALARQIVADAQVEADGRLAASDERVTGHAVTMLDLGQIAGQRLSLARGAVDDAVRALDELTSSFAPLVPTSAADELELGSNGDSEPAEIRGTIAAP